MANITVPNLNIQSAVVDGLNDYSYTIPTAGMYVASIQVNQPSSTGMTVAIKQNSTTKATVTLPGGAAAVQGGYILNAPMNISANDVVHFVFTSSSAPDQQLNSIKAVLNLKAGVFA